MLLKISLLGAALVCICFLVLIASQIFDWELTDKKIFVYVYAFFISTAIWIVPLMIALILEVLC